MSETFHGTRRGAEGRLSELYVQYGHDSPCPTMEQAWSLWASPWIDGRVSSGLMAPGSATGFRSVWRNHVQPMWGHRQLTAIRPPELQAWFSGLSAATAKKAAAVMRRCYSQARFHGACDWSPFDAGIELPRSGHGHPATPDLARVDVLWRKVYGTDMEGAFLLMAFGGCRVGESLAVRCADVREEPSWPFPVASAPIVAQAGKNSGTVTDRLKTPMSRRYAVLCGPPARRLVEVARERGNAGATWLSGDGWACMGTHRARYPWHSLTGGRYTMQSLRAFWETCARWTWMLPGSVIERAMGHAIPGVTGTNYDRPRRDDFVRPLAEAYAAHPWADGTGAWADRDD